MGREIPLPDHGRLTFEAEGQEGGRYHSRRLHVPGETSGLSLGRGYDMKRRTAGEVRRQLRAAGVSPAMAELLAGAAGLRGGEARDFIAAHGLEDFEIDGETQRRLFEIVYAEIVADTRRLSTKPDVTAAYGPTDWARLHPVIAEVLVDLRYRGDYTPASRRFLQRHVAANDLPAFAAALSDRALWPDVPPDRFRRRRDYCQAALAAATSTA